MKPTRGTERPPSTLDHFPDLDGIAAAELRSRFAMQTMDGGVSVEGEPGRSHVFNLVRLACKSVDDYNRARAHFKAIALLPRVQPFMGCTDALEDGITSTHRGYLFVERVRRLPSGDGEPVLNDAMTLRLKQVSSLVAEIRTLRDAIMHRDSDLLAPRPPNDAAYLAMGNLHIYVGDLALPYADLGRAIRVLFDVAESVVLQGENAASPRDPPAESPPMCPGALILHVDRTMAACTEDDEGDGCTGREAIHSLSPRSCVDEWGSCGYCGVK